MNCCDEYGKCCQGKDCPVREVRTVQYNTGFRRLDGILTTIAYVVTSLALTAIAGLLGVVVANFWMAK